MKLEKNGTMKKKIYLFNYTIHNPNFYSIIIITYIEYTF